MQVYCSVLADMSPVAPCFLVAGLHCGMWPVWLRHIYAVIPVTAACVKQHQLPHTQGRGPRSLPVLCQLCRHDRHLHPGLLPLDQAQVLENQAWPIPGK